MPSLLPSLFHTEVRYGAPAITQHVRLRFGGTTPLSKPGIIPGFFGLVPIAPGLLIHYWCRKSLLKGETTHIESGTRDAPD